MNDHFGVTGLELEWFKSYLRDGEQVCFVNSQTSSTRKVICGVSHGSILGPLMFSLYKSGMPDLLKITIPCLYADDTQMFSSYDSTELLGMLNSDLNYTYNWLVKNRLLGHSTKSKYMFIALPFYLNN